MFQGGDADIDALSTSTFKKRRKVYLGTFVRLVFCCRLREIKAGVFTVFLCPYWCLYKADSGWFRKLCRANINLKLLLFPSVLLLLSETVHFAIIEMSVQRRNSVDVAKGVDRSSSDFDLNCYKISLTSLDLCTCNSHQCVAERMLWCVR